MSPAPVRPLLRTPLLALLVLALLSGCAGLPERGPVEVQEPAEPSSSAAPFDFNPPGPVPDASPRQVVSGFLRALQATPASTAPAEQFLTEAAADQWRPDQATVVYGGLRTRTSAETVTVLLEDAFALDGNGRFAGALPAEAREVTFSVAREDGQWRIVEPPDALVVPRSYFATRYRPYSLYFFDPTGSVLVPERVHLPWGPQLPTRLVDGLLAGPPAGSRGVERSFLPGGARLDVSVPVRGDGVAEVPLTATAADADPDDLDRMLAQLAWTLRQATDVDAFEVTMNGGAVEPTRGGVVEVTGFERYEPTVGSATDRLFGVRGTRVVEVEGEEERPVAAVDVPGVRSLAVSLSGERFALVTQNGRAVVTVDADSGEDNTAETSRQVLTGADVRALLWDRTERLWVVDRRPGRGTAVTVLDGDQPVRLAVPGPDRDVVAAALSRDGTRLALLQRTASGLRLGVARVQRDGDGTPVGLTSPTPAAAVEPLVGARAVGWRDASTVAVLTSPSTTTTEVVLAAADGSSASVRQEPAVDVLFADGVDLTSDPGPTGQLVVTAADGRLHRLDAQGRWGLEPVGAGLRAATFAG